MDVFLSYLRGRSSLVFSSTVSHLRFPLIIGSLPRVEFPTSVQRGGVQTRLQNSIIERLLEDDEDIPPSVQLRRQQSMKFFIDNGYDLIHAALTGALQGVSRFRTGDSATNTSGVAALPRSTSTGSRFNGLLAFSQNFQPAVDWRLYSTQLQYILFELRTRFGSANRKLLNTTDIKSASRSRQSLLSFHNK